MPGLGGCDRSRCSSLWWWPPLAWSAAPAVAPTPPVMSVTPQAALLDQPVKVSVRGLRGEARTTVIASATDADRTAGRRRPGSRRPRPGWRRWSSRRGQRSGPGPRRAGPAGGPPGTPAGATAGWRRCAALDRAGPAPVAGPAHGRRPGPAPARLRARLRHRPLDPGPQDHRDRAGHRGRLPTRAYLEAAAPHGLAAAAARPPRRRA